MSDDAVVLDHSCLLRQLTGHCQSWYVVVSAIGDDPLSVVVAFIFIRFFTLGFSAKRTNAIDARPSLSYSRAAPPLRLCQY